MAWDGTTQERYRRDTERYESDLTDGEWSVAGPPVPPPSPPGRRRRIAVDAGGTPITVHVHTADGRDRDGAPDVILDMPGKAPEVRGLWADSGHGGDRLRERLAGMGVPDAPGIVGGPNGTRGFTVPSRRWVVERTFAWMSRCRRLARDSGRSLESSVAWARLAACRFPIRRLARGTSG